MRIAVVSPFVDRRHGTERALSELLEQLASKYGCEIHLYAQRVEDLALGKQQPTLQGESGAIIWHKVPSIPGPHVGQFLTWIFLNGFLRKWDKLVGSVSFDLVLSPGINCLHPDIVIVHALFRRLQELARGEKEPPAARAPFFTRLHRRIYYALLTGLERRIYSDRRVFLAAVSPRTAKLLKGYFHRADVSVIPNSVDAQHFSPTSRQARRGAARQRRGFRDQDLVLLLIGNDWRVKGLPTLLEAVAALPRLPINLLVVGNESVEPFRAHAVQLGVDGRCQWERSGLEALEFYGAADVYVSPSREDSFGLPVAEAMACGLPVITSGCAGISDYVHDGVDGFVLREPQDARTLAQLIERLYEEPELRRSLGSSAAREALEWDWNRSGATLWKLLMEVKAKRWAAGQ